MKQTNLKLEALARELKEVPPSEQYKTKGGDSVDLVPNFVDTNDSFEVLQFSPENSLEGFQMESEQDVDINLSQEQLLDIYDADITASGGVPPGPGSNPGDNDDSPYPHSEDYWIATHPVEAGYAYFNTNLAETYAQELAEHVGGNAADSLHNGYADAFRHALWSALNAEDFGIVDALELGYAHENSHPGPAAEEEMDLNNNLWGVEFAAANQGWSLNDFLDAFNDAVRSGDIDVIDGHTIPGNMPSDVFGSPSGGGGDRDTNPPASAGGGGGGGGNYGGPYGGNFGNPGGGGGTPPPPPPGGPVAPLA